MARKARVEFAGAVYHVLDRGDRREAIFRDDVDRERFLVTLGEACGRTGWRVHAFVLMGNHYHLMLETPQPNLVAGMRWFAPACARALSRKASAQTTWTIRFNRRHRVSGHLFQGRNKAAVVDPEERSYAAVLSDYIHLNPVRARMVGPGQRLFDYRWSSYPFYAATRGRPGWFEPRMVLGELGLDDSASGRRAYAERMRGRAVAHLEEAERPEVAELRRGWCLGGEGFRERMLRLIESARESLTGHTRRDAAVEQDHGLAEAQRIFEAGLRCCELREADLPTLRKGDARKLAIAGVIRKRTAVPNAWIASMLHLGHASRISRAARAAAENKWVERLEGFLAK